MMMAPSCFPSMFFFCYEKNDDNIIAIFFFCVFFGYEKNDDNIVVIFLVSSSTLKTTMTLLSFSFSFSSVCVFFLLQRKR
jgi:hypothetical protein